MGLLDSFSLDNLDDPKNQALLAMGLGLLQPKQQKTSLLGDVGQSGLLGLQTLVNAKTQERANRASDLQQLQGVYSILQNNEAMRWAAAKQSGQQYNPSPEYLAVQAKISKMSGLNTLSAPGTPAPSVTSPLPPTNQTMPPPVPGVAPPSQSPMSNPGYQPVPGMVRPNSATPAPAYAPPPQAPAQSSAQGSGFGAPAGGLDMTDFMMAANNPGLKMYVDQYAKDHSVQNVRSGGYILDANRNPVFYAAKLDAGIQPTFGANGQVTSASAIPGYAPAASTLAQATSSGSEAGKFPGRTETVKLADGRVVPQLLTSLVGNPYGGAQASAAGLPFVSPPAQSPQAPQVAQVTVTQPSKQADAVPQDPWATVPKRASPQGIGQSTYDEAMTKLQADTASKLAEKYGAQADVAQGRQALNNQALELVDRADTGMGAATLGDVKNALVSRFGIPESDFKNDPSATAALNKDLMNAAVAKAKASFGARMSTNEVNNMLKRGAPNGDMLSSAIKFLLTTDNATAGYQIQQANNLGKYLSVGGDPMQFEAWHAKTFPLSKTLDGLQLPANTSQNNNPGYGWSVKRVSP